MEVLTQFLSQLLQTSPEQFSFLQMLTALGVAYLGGILASLTPCIYPMIPITVSVVGGIGSVHEKRKALSEVWFRGLAYVGGMAVVYSFLGVLAGLTGKVFGSFTNTSGWYFSLGLIMNIAALIMLDIIPFDPAVWWQNIKRKLDHKRGPSVTHAGVGQEKEASLLGAFALGASSGFIAAPCTTPVLTSILAYIAKTQSVGLGLGLMLMFSLGLGTLLLLIAAFTGAIRVLPKSGKWMKKLKSASGILLLIFAEYLIYLAGKTGTL